ncbi:hypothetical protein Micbo1qcDRAFT_167919, partial [Microdochium bolleyi]
MQTTAGNIKLNTSQSAKTKNSLTGKDPLSASRIQDHVDIFALLASATPSAPSPTTTSPGDDNNNNDGDDAPILRVKASPSHDEWPLHEGRCVLGIACDPGSGSSLRLLRRLLAAKLPVDTIYQGLPLLHHAVQRGNIAGAQLLAKRGA